MLEKPEVPINNGQSREYWQHWAHKTQGEDKQNTTQKPKKISNTDPTKTGGEAMCSER